MSDSMLKDEDEVTIPRAALNKLIKEVTPEARVSTDARDLVHQICHEFIHLLASESNRVCHDSMKKTISPEHVMQALESLGLSRFKEEVEAAFAEAKEQAKFRRMHSASYKFKNTNMSQEELYQLQMQMFQEARAQMEEEMEVDRIDLQQAAAMDPAMAESGVGGTNDDDEYDT